MSQALVRFKGDLKKLAEKLDINIGIVQRKITFDLFTKITLRTPVDTGRARAGWDVTVGEPTAYVPPEGTYGDKPFPEGVQINGEQPSYVVNNLEYIEALEHGHSKQAPAGMVRISMLEVQAEIEDVLATLQ